MIYYSIVPPELVFSDESAQNKQQTQEVIVNGVAMVIEILGPTEAQVVRLLSPDPQHYLDARFQPGSRIRMVPSGD